MGGGETPHPHSTLEYVQWMSGVWKKNYEDQKRSSSPEGYDIEKCKNNARDLARDMHERGELELWKQKQRIFGDRK
jgi:hypothetical protein